MNLEKMQAEMNWLGVEFFSLGHEVQNQCSSTSEEDQKLDADRKRAEKVIAAAQAALTAMLEGFGGDGVTEWECFCDASYFDMWCVREVGERRFGHGFHLVNGDEAQRLCDHLNEQARHRQLSAAAERARIVAWLRAEIAPPFMPFETAKARKWLADAIERGEV